MPAPIETDYVRTKIGFHDVTVGPLTSDMAQALRDSIVDADSTQAYQTWIDWRPCPNAIDVKTFAQVRRVLEGSTRAQRWLHQFADAELIAALKTRGYRVPKKAHVRVAHITMPTPRAAYDVLKGSADWQDHVSYALARRMGYYLLKHGAIKIEELDYGGDDVHVGATATIIVGDPAMVLPAESPEA